jgi:hypothetical protein
MLEEYYTGQMILGHCNPISDLSIGVYIIFITLGITGNACTQNVIFLPGELFGIDYTFRVTDLIMAITFLCQSIWLLGK